ncbi:MAG: MmgE/PrpD family protein [Deltaproteobacteria bacterium]|nr:MmgE/PrpD family protein [Deltaproteobacteria bacterium]
MSGQHIARQLAEWVAGVTPESVPRRVVEEAKNQILGMLAAVHAGHFSDAGRVVSRTVRDWSGGKESTLIPSGERTAMHYAIAGNAALGMALDYDDYLLGARTGPTAVLAALALAEKIGVGGPELLAAQVVVNEVAGRIGLGAGLAVAEEPLAAFVHLAGGAVAGASLLKLDAAQTEHALAFALMQPGALQPGACFGSDAKVLSAALLAPMGIQAAEFAANGLRGASDPFDGEGGIFHTVGKPPLLGAFAGLGSVWLTESLGYKIYPAAHCLGTVIDAVLALRRQQNLDPRRVHAIHVGVGPLTMAMDARSAPFVRGVDSLASTLTQSVAYPVAVALIDKELSARQFTRDRIRDADVWALAGRVRLSLDDELARRARERAPLRAAGDGATPQLFDLTTLDLHAYKTTMGARVRIEMEGGRAFDLDQEAPTGSGARPFDDRRKAVEDKFRRETRFILRKERMEKAIDTVHHLENASAAQVRELARLVCSEKS